MIKFSTLERMIRAFFFTLLCFCSLQAFVLSEKQANDDAFFKNFKTDPFLGKFFEPVTIQQGLHYLNEIRFANEDLLELMDRFRENDLLGNPLTKNYPLIGNASPTTLRFIKTAGEIRNYFGSLQGYRILHLGAGYGGLCKILMELGGFTSYCIVQEKGTNLLCKKYLHQLGIDGIEYLSLSELSDPSQFDFVIIDGDFLTDSIDLTPLLQIIPRGVLLKKGIPEQFHSSINILKAAGFKGKFQGDLTIDENVLHLLMWKPDHEYLPFSFVQEKPAIYPSLERQEGVAVTNQVTKHRLGDQLLTYFSAKWFSLVQGVPFLLTPFPYADQFSLYSMDPDAGKQYRFKNKKNLRAIDLGHLFVPSTLWKLPFAPYSRQERMNFAYGKNFVKVDWENPEFRTLVRECLKPVTPIETIIPPKDRISVALHVRRGGAFKEDMRWDKALPLKFASDAFMIRQLKTVKVLFPDTPLYIFLFTDDLNPESIIEKYNQALGSSDIHWDYRRDSTPSSDQRVLADLLSFQNFDCLIRPCSHFSVIGGKLGRYQLEIGPTHFYTNDQNEPVIDQIELFFRPALTREEGGVLY